MQSGAARTNSLFPLLLVGLLAGMTYWLDIASQPSSTRADGKTRHDPDYIVSNFSVQHFSSQGELKNTLRAMEMRHFPDDDSTVVVAPDLIYHRSPPTFLTARAALISSKGEHIQLIDDVRVTRGGRNGSPDTLLTTTHLDVWPDDETASNHVPVTITQGLSHVSGSAMSANNKTSTYILEGRVNGTFYRKTTASPKPVAMPAKPEQTKIRPADRPQPHAKIKH